MQAGGTLTGAYAVFAYNVAEYMSGYDGYAGAIYLDNSTADLQNMTFTENSAERVGGVMYITGSTLSLLNVTIVNNHVRTDEGGQGTGGGWYVASFLLRPRTLNACYANCDNSTTSPLLTANDFQCFLNKFAAGDAGANCDQSTALPMLNANDFQCFMNQFATGCP